MDRLVAYCRASASGPAAIAIDGPHSIRGRFGPSSWPWSGTIGLHAARTLLAWRVAAMMGRISQEVVVALRGALHRKLMRLPMAYFDAQQTGRLMARVTSDVGSILMFIRSGILQLLNDLISSMAIAVLLAWLQWRLALVALVAVPLYALNQRAFFGRLRRLSDEIRAQVAALYALLSERVSAVRVVRSFAKEEDELSELDERIDRHRALSWDNTRAAAALGALATLISGLGTVFVIAYGIVLVGRGLLTVGELLAIYALVGQLYQPIVRLTQFQATALATQVSVERLYEIFDEPEPVRDRPGAVAIVRPRGAIEYRGVSFAYSPGRRQGPGRHRPADRAGDAPWRPGAQRGRQVDPPGPGPRLYDVPEGLDPAGPSWGTVCFDGRDVRDLRLADLRKVRGAGPAAGPPVRGTIRTNLLYANPEATEDQMWEALRIADLAATVDRAPRRAGYARRRARLLALRRAATTACPGPRDRRPARRPAPGRLHQRPGFRDRVPHPAGPRPQPSRAAPA